MAILRSSFSLCPLLGDKNLIGVSPTGDDTVVVTLSKSMAVRYKISDQSQLASWTTHHSLCSPVVFDGILKKYAAVVDKRQIWLWNEHTTVLDDAEKFQFNLDIHTVLSPCTMPGELVIVFANGHMISFRKAVDETKEFSSPFCEETDCIRQCDIVTCCGTNYGILIMSHNTSDKWDGIAADMSVVVVQLAGNNMITSHDMQCRRMSIRRDGLTILGATLLQDNNSMSLVTIWSDGQMLMYKLLPSLASIDSPGEYIHTISDVSCEQPVSVIQLDSSHIAMVGSDPRDEGAIVVLFNIQFCTVLAKLRLKIFITPPQLWKLNTVLLTSLGRSMMAIPFQLKCMSLIDLVGRSTENDISDLADGQKSVGNLAAWGLEKEQLHFTENVGDRQKLLNKLGKSRTAALLHQFERNGCTITHICIAVMSDLIASNNIFALLECFSYFRDIPEAVIVNVLILCFGTSGTDNLIDAAIHSMFSEDCMLRELKRLSPKEAIIFLQYLTSALHSEDLRMVQTLTNWVNLVVTAKSAHLHVQPDFPDVLMKLINVVEKYEDLAELANEYAAVLSVLESAKQLTVPTANKPYSIQMLHFR